MTAADANVARLHRCLVEALRARGPDALDRAVTVAEIYQDLIPYRLVRSKLNLELNADYEHALLRLLAGEGRYVRLEPASAREQLRRELELPDPHVGLYRNFAACDVWVSPLGGGAAAAVAAPPPAATQGASPPPAVAQGASTPPAAAPAARTPAAASAPPAPAAAAKPVAQPPTPTRDAAVSRTPAGPQAPRTGPAAAPAGHVRPRECAFCGGALPARADIHYCPFCGKDQRQRPCARCGAALERDWRFCIACGAPAQPPAAPA
ncbi:MAG TPA: zinc ribbon domain-containing protein [Longimicrobiales bacterium]